jgi:hypothetical protein
VFYQRLHRELGAEHEAEGLVLSPGGLK